MTFNVAHFAGFVHSIDSRLPIGSCFFAAKDLIITASHIFGEKPFNKEQKFGVVLIRYKESGELSIVNIDFKASNIQVNEQWDIAAIKLPIELDQVEVIPIIDQGIGNEIDVMGIGYPPDHLRKDNNPGDYKIDVTTIKSNACQKTDSHVLIQMPFIKGMSGGPVICPSKDYQLVGMVIENQSVGLEQTIYEEKEGQETCLYKEYIRFGKYLKITVIESVLKEMGLIAQMRRHNPGDPIK